MQEVVNIGASERVVAMVSFWGAAARQHPEWLRGVGLEDTEAPIGLKICNGVSRYD